VPRPLNCVLATPTSPALLSTAAAGPLYRPAGKQDQNVTIGVLLSRPQAAAAWDLAAKPPPRPSHPLAACRIYLDRVSACRASRTGFPRAYPSPSKPKFDANQRPKRIAWEQTRAFRGRSSQYPASSTTPARRQGPRLRASQRRATIGFQTGALEYPRGAKPQARCTSAGPRAAEPWQKSGGGLPSAFGGFCAPRTNPVAHERWTVARPSATASLCHTKALKDGSSHRTKPRLTGTLAFPRQKRARIGRRAAGSARRTVKVTKAPPNRPLTRTAAGRAARARSS